MLDHNNRFILGGDFNPLSHNSLIQTGLQSIYYGPTHKRNNLGRLYGINIDPKLFNPNTYVSHIKTHQIGVIALPLNIAPSHNYISRSIHTYRRRYPNQHKACLDYLSSGSFNLTYDNITESVDFFYTAVNSIFNKFYPLKQITKKSSYPPFINPFVKSLLRQKNCLMRKGKIHQVTSITIQIRNTIITSNKLSLAHSKRGSKAMWSTVNKLRGKIPIANIDADKFNSYFASISKSSNYIEPTHKLLAPNNINYITSSTVYYIFNEICPKGTGSDGLPGWFLNRIFLAICELCRPSTITALNRHFFQLSGKVVLFSLLKNK